MPLVIHNAASLSTPKKKCIFLANNRHFDAAPIPPTLVNSPHLSSPNSVFRRKSSVLRWPSPQEDEWLRDMVPIDRPPTSDADSKSEGSTDGTPSPTSSESSQGHLLFPPSPLLRPRSTPPEISTTANYGLYRGTGPGQSPHT